MLSGSALENVSLSFREWGVLQTSEILLGAKILFGELNLFQETCGFFTRVTVFFIECLLCARC